VPLTSLLSPSLSFSSSSLPLHNVVKSGQVDILKRILKDKPNLEVRDGADQTPLHVAATHNQV